MEGKQGGDSQGQAAPWPGNGHVFVVRVMFQLSEMFGLIYLPS